MSVIYECDGCGRQVRATAWHFTDGWQKPNGWLSNQSWLVCSWPCIDKLEGSLATPTVSTPPPALTPSPITLCIPTLKELEREEYERNYRDTFGHD